MTILAKYKFSFFFLKNVEKSLCYVQLDGVNSLCQKKFHTQDANIIANCYNVCFYNYHMSRGILHLKEYHRTNV
jgi:hypothetical protein